MIDTRDPGSRPPSIRARAKKQAMDWSLVLASQDIAALITKNETGWELQVDPADYTRALQILRQYKIENKGWQWRREVPGTSIVLHWGGLFWALAIGAIYYWSTVRFPWLKTAGMVDSRAILHGQWWRLFTAVMLHENLPHLIGNATIGSILVGLAMARYGVGIGTLSAFLAGVAGNYADVIIYPDAHYSLGASGMVTGALGLITVQSFTAWRQEKDGARILPRAVAGGLLILVLIGFSPGADWIAHLGGFLAGGVFGVALGRIRPAALHRIAANLAAGCLLAATILTTWWLATRASLAQH